MSISVRTMSTFYHLICGIRIESTRINRKNHRHEISVKRSTPKQSAVRKMDQNETETWKNSADLVLAFHRTAKSLITHQNRRKRPKSNKNQNRHPITSREICHTEQLPKGGHLRIKFSAKKFHSIVTVILAT